MKVGIDFGSTYSTIAHFNAQLGDVEAIAPAQGESVSIPSVVSVANRNGMVTCGKGAKEGIGRKTVRIFQAFKMLLTEADAGLLASRGYDDTYTPRKVAGLYLQSLLKTALMRKGEKTIDKLVICVPEIWGGKLNTLDGRMILRDILYHDVDQELGIQEGDVRIVTEPEAASAYFAYDYERETGKHFNGHLLLIDYGGGTLDITLTQVMSNGHGALEIGYREGGGAGENHPGTNGESTVGTAGIAYMQNVVVHAMRDANLLGENEAPNYTTPEFSKAVRDLETQLKSAERMKEIEDVFGEFGSFRRMNKILRREVMEFTVLEIEGEEVPVSYQHLFLAYQETIAGVLEQEIGIINAKVRQHIGSDPCDPGAGIQDDFKIALVGGFGSFYLVKQQIAEIYNLDSNDGVDPRTRNITANKREQAIALGAALIAADKITLQRTARYSIGLCTKDASGKLNIYYGIKYHQTIEPGKPYFLLHHPDSEDKPENRVTLGALHGNIKSFAIEFSERLNCGGLMDIKSSILDKLKQLPEIGFWNCGFSMDTNDVVSFHVVPSRYSADNNGGIVIPLDSFKNMFDLTVVREVEIPNGV